MVSNEVKTIAAQLAVAGIKGSKFTLVADGQYTLTASKLGGRNRNGRNKIGVRITLDPVCDTYILIRQLWDGVELIESAPVSDVHAEEMVEAVASHLGVM